MKLIIKEPEKVVRVEIISTGKCRVFTIDEKSALKVSDELYKLLPEKLQLDFNPKNPFPKCAVNCVESIGNKRGKNKRFTVYGLSVEHLFKYYMTVIK